MSMTNVIVALFRDGHRFHGYQIYSFGNTFYLKPGTLGIPKLSSDHFYYFKKAYRHKKLHYIATSRELVF